MTTQRIQSVDTLRGITIVAMILVNNPGTWNKVYAPLLHADWHGLTPTDLVFPFFLFIVGISIALAYQNKTPDNKTYKKIIVRSLKLIGLGLLINLFTPNFPFIEDLGTVRIPGVLQRIGIVFLAASIIFLNFSTKAISLITVSILVGYYLLTGFTPLPNGAIPSFENNLNNWSNFVDYHLLGKHMWREFYDPEGFLGTIPSIATSLLGVLTGKILTSTTKYKKEKILLGTSFLLLLLGYLWNLWYPINKATWSSSYVITSGGWALLILSITYYINDVKEKNISKIFTYVSRNAIVVYFLSMIIAKSFYHIKINDTQNLHGWLYNNLLANFIGDTKLASFLYAFSVVGCYLFLSFYLYRKKIFFKV